MLTRCNRGFYCRSYSFLNMFRAPLCPSSGAQEYYTVVAACGISCCGFQVFKLLVWCGAELHTRPDPKHVEQAIRSAIKTSVASSWHFISTYVYNVKRNTHNAETNILKAKPSGWKRVLAITNAATKGFMEYPSATFS